MKHALLAVPLLAFSCLPKAFADDSQNKFLEQQLAETEAKMKELQSKISPIQSQLDERRGISDESDPIAAGLRQPLDAPLFLLDNPV